MYTIGGGGQLLTPRAPSPEYTRNRYRSAAAVRDDKMYRYKIIIIYTHTHYNINIIFFIKIIIYSRYCVQTFCTSTSPFYHSSAPVKIQLEWV